MVTMPRKKIFEASVDFLQVLDENGNCDEELMPKLSTDQVKELYKSMVLARVFDEKAFSLQRQGRLGTYAPLVGQEAAQIGSAYALNKEDWMFPGYRENGSIILRGMPLDLLFQFWAGDERGSAVPKGVNNFTITIPVGTQVPHAVGAAMAAKIKKDKIAVLVYFGDGATSKGDFSEGMNFAGVFKAPVVLMCHNNQYAISVPIEKQTAAKTIAQKAIAFGFEGVRVDGNDVFAVYKATKEALDKARAGQGPTLIECLTYRIGDHTTSDDWTIYRKKEEVEEWKKKDPIERLSKYAKKKGLWDEKFEEQVRKECEALINEAVKKAESAPKPKPEDMFKYTYAEMPKKLQEQLKDAFG